MNRGIERSVNSNLNFTIRSTIDTNMQSAVYDICHLNFDLKDVTLFYFLKLIFVSIITVEENIIHITLQSLAIFSDIWTLVL